VPLIPESCRGYALQIADASAAAWNDMALSFAPTTGNRAETLIDGGKRIHLMQNEPRAQWTPITDRFLWEIDPARTSISIINPYPGNDDTNAALIRAAAYGRRAPAAVFLISRSSSAARASASSFPMKYTWTS
jgi:hypothetical protein